MCCRSAERKRRAKAASESGRINVPRATAIYLPGVLGRQSIHQSINQLVGNPSMDTQINRRLRPSVPPSTGLLLVGKARHRDYCVGSERFRVRQAGAGLASRAGSRGCQTGDFYFCEKETFFLAKRVRLRAHPVRFQPSLCRTAPREGWMLLLFSATLVHSPPPLPSPALFPVPASPTMLDQSFTIVSKIHTKCGIHARSRIP